MEEQRRKYRDDPYIHPGKTLEYIDCDKYA